VGFPRESSLWEAITLVTDMLTIKVEEG